MLTYDSFVFSGERKIFIFIFLSIIFIILFANDMQRSSMIIYFRSIKLVWRKRFLLMNLLIALLTWKIKLEFICSIIFSVIWVGTRKLSIIYVSVQNIVSMIYNLLVFNCINNFFIIILYRFLIFFAFNQLFLLLILLRGNRLMLRLKKRSNYCHFYLVF